MLEEWFVHRHEPRVRTQFTAAPVLRDTFGGALHHVLVEGVVG